MLYLYVQAANDLAVQCLEAQGILDEAKQRDVRMELNGTKSNQYARHLWPLHHILY